jgi:hypothetical protein
MKKIYLVFVLSLTTVMTKAQCLVQVAGTNIKCNGMCNGTATATPVGVPNYSYMWMPGGMTTANVSGLCPGTYTVTVVDGTSCTSTGTVTITEPAVLNVTSTQTNVSCPGLCNGSATAFVSGGTSPYTHKWTTTPTQTTATASNLCAATYNDSITDGNGCKTILSNVTITQPGPFTASVLCSGVSCFGGSNGTATASQSGGTPGYSYSWNTLPAQTTKTISNLSPGTYSCTVTDTMGCTSTAGCTVNQPSAALSVSVTSNNATCSSCCDGTANAAPAGGTSAYTYSWTPGGQTTQSVTGLCPGNYSVCVTDANGCSICGQVSVNFNAGIQEISSAYTRLYPNPAAENFDLEITQAITGEVKVSLVDIIGNELLSETIHANGTFHKKFEIQNLPAGIYFVKVKSGSKTITQRLIKN